MKCVSCDCILTDAEQLIKYDWGEPINLCEDCLSESFGQPAEEFEELGEEYESW